jgi:hypothetical protein
MNKKEWGKVMQGSLQGSTKGAGKGENGNAKSQQPIPCSARAI